MNRSLRPKKDLLMKKYLGFIVLSLLAACVSVRGDSPFHRYPPPQDVFIGQSFMFTRPGYQRLSMKNSLWHSVAYNEKGPQEAAFQSIGYYQESSPYDYGPYYFMPSCKKEIMISGDDQKSNIYYRDVRAEWLNLPSDFVGFMSLCPAQRQAGAIIEYQQDFSRFTKNDFLNDYWLNISIPLVWVKNDIGLTQAIGNYGTPVDGQPRDIRQAFRQCDWYYSKICGAKQLVEPAEINFRLGKAYLSKNNFQLIYYTGLSIPMSKGQDARYMFAPVAGYNGQLGLEVGFQGQIVLSKDEACCVFCLFAELESIFLLQDKQYRTFDLCRKPWSRFMLFNRRHGPPDQRIPGVNVLTRRVQVSPYTVVDFATGWRMKVGNIECEFGYGLWGHGTEKIEFLRKCQDERFGCRACYNIEPCDQGTGICRPCHQTPCSCEESEFGIAGTGCRISPISGQCEATSACQSTINYQASNDDAFISIRDSDLDLLSASSRSAILHSAYASVGTFVHRGNITSFCGAGLAVDVPQRNSSLAGWSVWVKGGATF